MRITFPDGRALSSESAGIDRVLSDELRREVTLAASAPESPVLAEYWPDIEGLALREETTDEAMPTGTFFDLALVHMLTTGTIDRLRDSIPTAASSRAGSGPTSSWKPPERRTANVGVYASVVRGGTIRRGDGVRAE